MVNIDKHNHLNQTSVGSSIIFEGGVPKAKKLGSIEIKHCLWP